MLVTHVARFGFAVGILACGTDGGSANDAGAADAGSDVRPGTPTLTLSLDATLDQADDDVKATTLSSGVLLGKTGTMAASASIVGGAAVFDLTGVTKGDYFIVVNGITDRPIPTRVDDASVNVVQRVGQKLRASYVGPAGSPSYRINTYPDGKVVKFSDDTVVGSDRPYVVVTFAPSKVELNVLGTATNLTSLPLDACLGHSYVPADGWLLNTNGEDHHGDVFNGDGGAANCSGCHTDYWLKKPSYGDITPSRGWCFRCHDGPSGTSSGFVNPLK